MSDGNGVVDAFSAAVNVQRIENLKEHIANIQQERAKLQQQLEDAKLERASCYSLESGKKLIVERDAARDLVGSQAELLRSFVERLRVFEDREHLVRRLAGAIEDTLGDRCPEWRALVSWEMAHGAPLSVVAKGQPSAANPEGRCDVPVGDVGEPDEDDWTTCGACEREPSGRCPDCDYRVSCELERASREEKQGEGDESDVDPDETDIEYAERQADVLERQGYPWGADIETALFCVVKEMRRLRTLLHEANESIAASRGRGAAEASLREDTIRELREENRLLKADAKSWALTAGKMTRDRIKDGRVIQELRTELLTTTTQRDIAEGSIREKREQLSAMARALAVAPTKPVCSTCSDTHKMYLSEDDGRRVVMCTGCPSPCRTCASNGGRGAYCAKTPCDCDCHADSWQYREHRMSKRAVGVVRFSITPVQPGDDRAPKPLRELSAHVQAVIRGLHSIQPNNATDEEAMQQAAYHLGNMDRELQRLRELEDQALITRKEQVVELQAALAEVDSWVDTEGKPCGGDVRSSILAKWVRKLQADLGRITKVNAELAQWADESRAEVRKLEADLAKRVERAERDRALLTPAQLEDLDAQNRDMAGQGENSISVAEYLKCKLDDEIFAREEAARGDATDHCKLCGAETDNVDDGGVCGQCRTGINNYQAQENG